MSRVSLIEQLYAPKRKSALEFNYDKLWAPPIRFFLSQQDINELYKIATSLKYNDNIEKKYELIDAIMKPRGFKRGNCGTNRVVYNFLEDTSFCMKIALDRVGIKDSPREFKNQEFFKPFCCKIFEVDPTGVIACVERVNPISSLEEFASISDDVFNMMITKIIGKYVVDDLGTDKFMNYGIRYNSNGIAFGPVVLDYPYAYELDGAKLHCAKPIVIGNQEFACGGEIDYDAGLNNLVCCKCGRTYSARELAKDDSNILKFYSDDEQCRMRARIVRETDGAIVKDSGRSSKVYMTKEQYEEGTRLFEVKDFGPRPVEKSIKKKYTPMKKLREEYYTELQLKAYQEMQERDEEPVNPVIKSEFAPRPAARASKAETKSSEFINCNRSIPYPHNLPCQHDVIIRLDGGTPARRAEDITPQEFENESEDFVSKLKEVIYEDSGLPKDIIERELNSESLGFGLTEANKHAEKFISKLEDTHNKVLDTLSKLADYVKEHDLMEEECNLNNSITEAINEVLNEEDNDCRYPYTEEDTYESSDKVEQENEEPMVTYDESGIVDMTEEEYYGHKLEVNNQIKAYEEFKESIESTPNPGLESVVELANTINKIEKELGYNMLESNETQFSDEMEADVFPEISNQGIIVGVNFGEEPDYSDYVPDEEEDNNNDYEDDQEVDYSDLFKENRKENKRSKKPQKGNKKYTDDMSDY